MKAIPFSSVVVLAGVLLVSVGADAQESPYHFWGLQDGTRADTATSADDAIPFQIRRRFEDQPGPSSKPEDSSDGEPLAGHIRAVGDQRSKYYVAPTGHRVSGSGYATNFTTGERHP